MHSPQKVHSNVQMNAASPGARPPPHRSQAVRISRATAETYSRRGDSSVPAVGSQPGFRTNVAR